MDLMAKVKEFVQKKIPDYELESIEELKQWNGIRVFSPNFKGNPIIGIFYIFVEGDNIRFSDGEETEEYLQAHIKSLTPEEFAKEKEKAIKELEEEKNIHERRKE